MMGDTLFHGVNVRMTATALGQLTAEAHLREQYLPRPALSLCCSIGKDLPHFWQIRVSMMPL